MGRTVPSITLAYQQELEALGRFRRALRRSDQLVLDDLLSASHQHLAAAAYGAHTLPFELFLVAMLLEERKEVLHLRARVEHLQGQVERLLPPEDND